MTRMKEPVTRLDYCQYLRVSQINYPLTNLADHGEKFSHHALHRSLRGERIPARRLGENVPGPVTPTQQSYLVFDDTGLDKDYSPQMERVRYQDRGNAKSVIKGLGGDLRVRQPPPDRFGLMDCRIDDPAGDGQSQLDHVRAMLCNGVCQKPRPFRAVRRDTWSARKDLMLCIEGLRKVYSGPLKDNRWVDDAGGGRPDQRVEALDWSAAELAQGQVIQVKGFPQEHQVRCFRGAVSSHRTDGVVTNDWAQAATEATQPAGGFRGKMEPLHREGKQVTGLERCPCRQGRMQRHPIGGAFLVGIRFKELAAQTGRTVYQLKQGLRDDDLTQQLKIPSLKMVLA